MPLIASDTDLWNAFRGGSTAAFEGLYRRFYARLFRYGRTFTRDDELVEDCIQDLFLNLHRYRPTLKVPDANGVAFYLFGALRNTLARQLSVAQRSRDAWRYAPEETDLDLSIEEALMLQEFSEAQRQKLNRVLEGLPQRQREAVYLKFYSDLTFVQIAEVMDVNPQSAKNFIQKALHELRRHLLLVPLATLAPGLYAAVFPGAPQLLKKISKK
jgi:RNA polymerase sigma factor (sigma-70 family)